MGYVDRFLIVLFFLMLHEMTHVAVALFLKLNVNIIEILPFGEIAKIDNIEQIGILKEIIIYLAGPIINICSAIFLFIVSKYTNISSIQFMINFNIYIGVFNLLPGLPLDGGRILCAILNYYISYKKAFNTAAFLGEFIAACMFVIGVVLSFLNIVNISLLFLPIVLFISILKEKKTIIYIVLKNIFNKKSFLRNRCVIEVYNICVFEDTKICEVFKYFEFEKYNIVYILDSNMNFISSITETEFLKYIEKGNNITVGELYSIIEANK